jgi:hypothetical protein
MLNMYLSLLCLVQILTPEFIPEMMDEVEEEVETVKSSEAQQKEGPSSSVDPVKPKIAENKADKPTVKKEDVVKVEKVNKVSSKAPEGVLISPMATSTPNKDSDVRQRKSPSSPTYVS